MVLGSQELHPRSFVHHLVARAHRKSARSRNLLVGLTLTSMVDMFSLLVVFLLQTFSASPELLIVSKGLELPVAATGKELKDAPLLSISNEGVFLDQKLVGTVDAVIRNPEPLMERLEGQRRLWQKTHPSKKFPGEINLQAHREIPSTTVAQVMNMLPSQAYGSIQLAIVSGSLPVERTKQ